MATMIVAVVMLAAVSAVELERSCGAAKAAACEELGNRLQAGLGVRRGRGPPPPPVPQGGRGEEAGRCADDARALALGGGAPGGPPPARPGLLEAGAARVPERRAGSRGAACLARLRSGRPVRVLIPRRHVRALQRHGAGHPLFQAGVRGWIRARVRRAGLSAPGERSGSEEGPRAAPGGLRGWRRERLPGGPQSEMREVYGRFPDLIALGPRKGKANLSAQPATDIRLLNDRIQQESAVVDALIQQAGSRLRGQPP